VAKLQRKQPDFLGNVRQALSGHSRVTTSEWEATPAAVLLPLFKEEDEWCLLYTRRTESLNAHRGQVSFPGGMIEDFDQDPIEAALREVEEEIGIPREQVEILGCVDNMFTVTQFSITPVVGKIPWPIAMQLNETEVARAFGVPLSWLSDEANLETEERDIPGLGLRVPVHFFEPYDDEIIWGATARITLNFLEIIGLK
jgi:8-oxo-dGTP pyrophosphatase MutT (NUDIX family)